VFPFVIYLAIFYVHFSILIYSGPGDSFMSPAFQETLKGNELLLNAQGESAIVRIGNIGVLTMGTPSYRAPIL
jgi:dolichyl-phosphate-mannose--protein O-mannosyl transferase